MMRSGIDITKPFNRMLDACANFVSAIKDFKFKAPKKRNKAPKANKWSEKKEEATTTNNKSTQSKEKATASPEDQADLDRILDKIKKSGYTALSAEEKKRLFDVSSRIK